MSRFERPSLTSISDVIDFSEQFIRGVEAIVAYLLVVLFAVGTADIGIQIIMLFRTGQIIQPDAVIRLLDRVLLLFIIVELHQTVTAYSRAAERIEIVTTVVYAGVIAMVRKAILFRTTDYPDLIAALTAAGSYTLILAGLAVVLLVLSHSKNV
jgi:uncharacterized membrane protein (DUF373 family)